MNPSASTAPERRLRLQIALRALAGNSVPVQDRLRDLRGRLAAIDELEAMDLHG